MRKFFKRKHSTSRDLSGTKAFRQSENKVMQEMTFPTPFVKYNVPSAAKSIANFRLGKLIV